MRNDVLDFKFWNCDLEYYRFIINKCFYVGYVNCFKYWLVFINNRFVIYKWDFWVYVFIVWLLLLLFLYGGFRVIFSIGWWIIRCWIKFKLFI